VITIFSPARRSQIVWRKPGTATLGSGVTVCNVLHHAEKGTTSGAGKSEEPVKNGPEQAYDASVGSRLQRRRALNRAKLRVRELYGELIEGK
jgi:hypothetical protein